MRPTLWAAFLSDWLPVGLILAAIPLAITLFVISLY